jgi:hypothetical protein
LDGARKDDPDVVVGRDGRVRPAKRPAPTERAKRAPRPCWTKAVARALDEALALVRNSDDTTEAIEAARAAIAHAQIVARNALEEHQARDRANKRKAEKAAAAQQEREAREARRKLAEPGAYRQGELSPADEPDAATSAPSAYDPYSDFA